MEPQGKREAAEQVIVATLIAFGVGAVQWGLWEAQDYCRRRRKKNKKKQAKDGSVSGKKGSKPRQVLD